MVVNSAQHAVELTRIAHQGIDMFDDQGFELG